MLRPSDKTEFNGSPALVMDFIEGGTLSALLKKHGPLPVDRVTSFAIQIVNALDAVHAKGIVHRDLKPQNILIDIKTDHLYLIDFGYARDMEDVDGSLTVPGAPIGTSFYASPEQMIECPVDQRTDIYSFGLLLRDMCAGQPHHAVGIRPPVPEDLPAHLSAVILRCTQDNPADRYVTAQQILADLQGSARAPGRWLQDWSRQCLMAASAVVRERIGRYRYPGLILTALLLTGIFLSNRRLNTSTNQTNVHQGKQEFAITDSDAIPTSSHQLYLEALQELGTDDLESKKRGAHLLKRAIEADPSNLQAHIMAATANLELYKAEQEPDYISEAEGSATRARSLGQD
ncbi:MAG: protein kinase domain-containing protein, partial [Nitrososphaeraceae archaeon]